MEFRFISTDDPIYAHERQLRVDVLRAPLSMPPGSELTAFEDEALHLVAVDGDRVVGCVMFKPGKPTGRMLQMAVAETYQHRGIGTQLVRTLEEHLRTEGYAEIYIYARDYAIPFYEKLGYRAEGEPFVRVGITHRLMKKILTD